MFLPSSDFLDSLQKFHHDTCIKYEASQREEKEDTYLNYESINSKPAREEQGDKKLQEGAKEIAEAIRRWWLDSKSLLQRK